LCARYLDQPIPNRAERLQQPCVSKDRFGLDAPHAQTTEVRGHPLGGLQKCCLPDTGLTFHHQGGRRTIAGRLEQGTQSRELVIPSHDLAHHVWGFPPREGKRRGATVQRRQVV
jgi:hypothetical protein